ncbi:pancreatic lipase-related protein 3-like [Haliotis rubra]|uniref:pancreatic lipase-related protein 3-like n=1 Tax=Haliotis rubra TaxID=36100 RepID=UPI001EE5AEB9|nr:pancreatic lipase-related protein 3-like [Haliotis rubra]
MAMTTLYVLLGIVVLGQKKDNFNVITVDWRSGAHKFYPKSVANTRLVGAIIAKTVEIARDRMEAKMADVHLIGHSLGSHISGYVGSRIEGVGRISGLDPAGPLFEGTDPAVRLDPTDAIYVDNIHTDGLPLYDAGFGTMSAWGHVDFYPNGGGDQPGCPAPVEHGLLDVVEFKFNVLSHPLLQTIFVQHFPHQWAAVTSGHMITMLPPLADAKCDFTAHPCASYKDFTDGSCSSCGSGTCPQMGYFSDRANRQGKFYLTTENTYPFCHLNFFHNVTFKEQKEMLDREDAFKSPTGTGRLYIMTGKLYMKRDTEAKIPSSNP